MAISMFINFNGNCKEAVQFYAQAFETELQDFMTYDQMPADAGPPPSAETKNRVMYTNLFVGGGSLMFCDFPAEMDFRMGNNISPVISYDDTEKIKRIFANLSQGGKVDMELQQTFWSKLYGMVTDKYGVVWQLDYDDGSTMM